MTLGREQRRALAGLLICVGITGAAALANTLLPGLGQLPSGLNLLELVELTTGIIALTTLGILITHFILARQHKPPVEATMLGRIYYLLAGLIIVLGVAYAFGQLGAFGSFLSLFGGMLLGWSLQAPVSGFAAYVLVSLMRPFRPGDHIQFPNLGLVGDVKDVGILTAAREVTCDIIAATGAEPYIRSDLYDYGIYLRLRYQTQVNRRAEIAYLLSKRICEDIQRTRSVDLAIPDVYSYRAGAERLSRDRKGQNAQDIDMSLIDAVTPAADPHDIELLAQSIASQGLLQPIVVARQPRSNRYRVVAGELRFAACRHLGWRTISAVVVEKHDTGAPHSGSAAAIPVNTN